MLVQIMTYSVKIIYDVIYNKILKWRTKDNHKH